MSKETLQKISIPLTIFGLAACLIAIALLLFGQIQPDATDGDGLGLYSSILKGLPSYYNPLANLLQVVEALDLFVMPLLLGIFYKKLKNIVLPWLFALIGLLITAIFVHMRPYEINPEVSSVWPRFWEFQPLPLIGLMAGYTLLLTKRKQSKDIHE